MIQDIKVENGGIVYLPSCCNEEKVTDTEAVFQRIKIALSLEKGKFPYDKTMGLERLTLDFTKERNVKTLEMLINETICEIWDCKGKIISLDTERMVADMLFVFKNNSYRTEVKLYG